VTRRTQILMWVSLFAAPVAWVASHVVGWNVSEARCDVTGQQWGIAIHTWEIVLLTLAVALALVGLISSWLVYRQVKDVDYDADPPAGRLQLLSISGLVVSFLLLVAIILTHTAALNLTPCMS
jgi:heme/copper-type cytochrome/quinol oxidase subunit 2